MKVTMLGSIIEGVTGSGKSRILEILHKRLLYTYPLNSRLFLNEHYTERMVEHLKEQSSLNEEIVLEHARRILQPLELYKELIDNSKFQSGFSNASMIVTLERFVLTHLVNLEMQGRQLWDEDFPLKLHSFFHIVGAIGLKQIILYISLDSLSHRILSTMRYRNKAWKDYLLSIGNEKEILDHYGTWQENLLRAARNVEEQIDTLFIDVSDDNYENHAERIFEYVFQQRT
jgi:thymidylate kinase